MIHNRNIKSIQRVPSKQEGVKLIGKEVNDQIITNIEHNGQIRVIPVNKKKNFKIQPDVWKERYMDVGLKLHPGTLLSQHKSAELYEEIVDQGLMEA